MFVKWGGNSLKLQFNDYPVWVFWYQGVEEMPELVKGCYQHLVRNNRNVILITKLNFREYCSIPDYILGRVERGEISFTHFSDILRVSLLAEHGGLWLDSTCWVANTISDEVYAMELFTPRTKGVPDLPFWSNSRWCTWCTGTNRKNNPLFVFVRDLLYIFLRRISACHFIYLMITSMIMHIDIFLKSKKCLIKSLKTTLNGINCIFC